MHLLVPGGARMPAAAFKSLRFPKSEPSWAHSLAHSLLQNLLFFLRKVAYAPFSRWCLQVFWFC